MSITMRRAFTIVELLVVVTIIVVLLSLLVPAMSKAIYQAQLVKCATNYRFLVNASQNYALDYQKKYPYRDLPNPPNGASWPLAIQAHKLTHPLTGSGAPYYDLRPLLRPYAKINDVFNDPMCIPLDYDNPNANGASTTIYTSVFYWGGWYFRNGRTQEPMRGIFKLGSRFEAYDEFNPSRLLQMSVLAGDIDCASDYGQGWSSHPDGGNFNNQVASSDTAMESNWTGPRNRLPIDLNFAFEDGSVRQVRQVAYYERGDSPRNNDERMVRIANMNNQSGIDAQWNNVPLN
jgi:prepilin-type N-terminal cleavage/methylation domain-containing protein